jgi:hypothetical protein
MNLASSGEEGIAMRRPTAEQAIQLALEGKWEEAVAVNRSILSLQPNDVDTWNRLGKALMELGRYLEARDAYKRALELDAVNNIARRNLERLNVLSETAEERRKEAVATTVPREIFIEETGKTGTTVLQDVSADVAVRLSAGDMVFLKAEDNVLAVENAENERVGAVEPKLGLRLIRLMEGGNQYAAAVKSLSEGEVQVIIKETYKHPSQEGKMSFPPIATEVRPYIKESLLRYETEEEEETEPDVEAEDWDVEPEAQETVGLSALKESLADEEEDEDA